MINEIEPQKKDHIEIFCEKNQAQIIHEQRKLAAAQRKERAAKAALLKKLKRKTR